MIPILAVVVLIVITLAIQAALLERKAWNGGYCPKCRNPWQYFATDSQGGRGYKCGAGHGAWIGWGWDKEAKTRG